MFLFCILLNKYNLNIFYEYWFSGIIYLYYLKTGIDFFNSGKFLKPVRPTKIAAELIESEITANK